MSKNKRRLQIQRNARIITPPKEETQQLFFFKVYIDEEEISGVEQVPDFPFESTEDNGSLLSFAGAGFAIHVTWLPYKPAPRSELRYKGYLAIQEDIGSRDPKLAKMLRTVDFGFGHPDPGYVSIEWHPPRGDDA